MIIGIDFDNILFPTTEVVIDAYNVRHHTDISLYDINTYSFYDCLSKQVADEIISYFNEKWLYNSLWPISKSRQVVQKLINKGHQVFIATATDAKNLVWKEELLERFFPFIPKENVIKIHKKELLKFDVLIDDCLEHLVKSSGEKICFSYPWNQKMNPIDKFHRVKSWEEIINIINQIERKTENE